MARLRLAAARLQQGQLRPPSLGCSVTSSRTRARARSAYGLLGQARRSVAETPVDTAHVFWASWTPSSLESGVHKSGSTPDERLLVFVKLRYFRRLHVPSRPGFP